MEIKSVLALMTLLTTVLRSNQNSLDGLHHADFLRLLMQDRYVVTLLEFFARQRIRDQQMKQVFQEALDELKHCYYSVSYGEKSQLEFEKQ